MASPPLSYPIKPHGPNYPFNDRESFPAGPEGAGDAGNEEDDEGLEEYIRKWSAPCCACRPFLLSIEPFGRLYQRTRRNDLADFLPLALTSSFPLSWPSRLFDDADHMSSTLPLSSSSNPLGVLNERLHVRGVRGLRVGDASVFPTVLAAHTQAAVVVVGEKLSAMVAEDWEGGERQVVA
jgi:choline dehydrogenase-like flavoprotein